MMRSLVTTLAGLLLLGAACASMPLSRAQQPFDVRVPSTMIVYFDRTTATGCPVGWTELTAARGAALVGLVSGGTKGVIVGAAFTNQENRTHTHPMPHTHTLAHVHTASGTTSASTGWEVSEGAGNTIAQLAHTHTFTGSVNSAAGSTGAASVGETDVQSALTTPYLQLLRCVKN